MSDNLQYMYFSSYSFHIALVLNLVFLKDLDGNFFTSDKVSSQSNFTKSSLAKWTTYNWSKINS